jgi:anti-sigma regulatory factor (Ser/Thr protein kinase)
VSQLLVSRLKFAATATAPRCARVFVGRTLQSWLLTEVLDDAELVVSELVTNAVKATGTVSPHQPYAEGERLAIVGVQVRVSGAAVFVEVWDRDSDKPVAAPCAGGAAVTDEGGRGLAIVGTLSRRYGVVRPSTGGKVVWAELPAATLPRTPAPPTLPHGSRLVPTLRDAGAAQHAQADVALTQRLSCVAM